MMRDMVHVKDALTFWLRLRLRLGGLFRPRPVKLRFDKQGRLVSFPGCFMRLPPIKARRLRYLGNHMNVSRTGRFD